MFKDRKAKQRIRPLRIPFSFFSHVKKFVLRKPRPVYREPERNYNRPTQTVIIDHDIPRSTPLHEKDIHIPKRMIIAGSYYCDEDALAPLRVGCYIKLIHEPYNSHDPGAVRLEYDGKKIGYIPRADRGPFTRCLASDLHIYGVITDIRRENGRLQYEFETWFEDNTEISD